MKDFVAPIGWLLQVRACTTLADDTNAARIVVGRGGTISSGPSYGCGRAFHCDAASAPIQDSGSAFGKGVLKEVPDLTREQAEEFLTKMLGDGGQP